MDVFSPNTFVWVDSINGVIKATEEAPGGIMDMRSRQGLKPLTKPVLRDIAVKLGAALTTAETTERIKEIFDKVYRGPETAELDASEVPITPAGGIDAALRAPEQARRKVARKVGKGVQAAVAKRQQAKQNRQAKKQKKQRGKLLTE